MRTTQRNITRATARLHMFQRHLATTTVPTERLQSNATASINPTWREIPLAITYDDVLLVPKRSPVRSRRGVNMRTRLSRNITLNNPIVSSNMDTVTEAEMAIEMARNGGIGIIHRFLSVEEQVKMLIKVKRAESYLIENPYCLDPKATLGQLNDLMEDKGVHSVLITDKENHLLGIVTSRDIRFTNDHNITVDKVMTPRSSLIVARPGVSLEEAKNIISANKVKKLPLVDADNVLRGLITSKDIMNHIQRPFASLDSKGRLLVGAAVGVKDGFIERARALVQAGCDVLVIDIAHGHSDLAIDALRQLKKNFPDVDVIAGNVATAEVIVCFLFLFLFVFVYFFCCSFGSVVFNFSMNLGNKRFD